MYYLVHGHVELRDKFSKIICRVVKEGELFGLEEFFTDKSYRILAISSGVTTVKLLSRIQF